MNYRKPTQAEADLIAQTGANPADFLIDEQGNEAIPVKELDTWTGAAAELGKGAVRSVRDMVAGAVKFPGTIADAVGGDRSKETAVRLTDKDESIFTTLGDKLGLVGESVIGADPNLDQLTKRRIASKVGGALGSVAALAGPGLATKGASLAAETVPLALSALQGAQNVNDRAEAQGKTTQDAAAAGLSYLPISFVENLGLMKLGAGMYGPRMSALLGGRLNGAGTTALKEAGMGAAGGAVDELTQQRVASEDIDLGQAAEAAALGGLAQGTIAKVAGAGKKPVQTEDLAARMAGDQAAQAEAAQKQKIVADEALEARIAARLDAQGRGERYDTIKPTPVDEVFQEAQRRKIPVDADMLRSLEEIYADNAANEKKVYEAARLLLDRGRVTRPNKNQPTPEMVKAQQDELAKIDSQLDAVDRRRSAIIEKQADRAKEAMKTPPAADAGDVWLQMAEERAATEMGELKLLEQQYAQLLEQRKLLTQQDNVTPEGGPQPLEVGQMPPKVLMAKQAEAQKAGRLLTADEAAAQNREAIRKQGEEASAAERAKLSGELTPAQRALMEQAEGEQGLPFSGDRTEVYGTLIPPSIIEAFRKRGLRTADPIRLLHEVTQHHLTRLAKRGPVGAYAAAKINRLFLTRDQIANRKRAEFDALQERYPNLLTDARYLAWKNQAHSARAADISKLPKELQQGASEMELFIKSFHKEQNERGVAVWERTPDGKYTARPAEDVEGYGIYNITPEFYRAMEEGGKQWDVFERAWKENWISHKGSEAGADEALQSMRGSFARARFSGGEPLFSAVRNQIGVPLPEIMRSKNLADSMNHYIDSWAKDIAYAEVVQNDPLMRRALGVTHDAAGVNRTAEDAAYRPTKDEWKLMIDRGQRVDADWVSKLEPNMPLDQPISGRDPFGINLYASYTQTPLTSSKAGRAFNTINQIAATAMMQHMSKLRNIAQSGITVVDYTLGKEAPVAWRALLDSVMHPVAAVERGQKAGAIPLDVVQHEFADALSGGLYKALRGFRKWTGLNAMDMYAKSVAYNVAEAAVSAQVKRLGADAPLLKEFANTDMLSKGGNIEALVREAAATIANHVDPQFDVRSLPGGMIPQNREFVGNLFRLMTWSVGRFNHWYTDAYLPAVTGGDKTRLLSSLFIGALGAAATQELLAWLQDKMPRDLSLGEWLRLDSEQQQKEFAPMLFGYLQAQGSMGVLGDIAYAGVRVANDRPVQQDYTRPMLPALLIGDDLRATLWDFHKYAVDEKGSYANLDLTDLMKLGVELAKVNQTIRSTLGRGDDWLPERLKDEADAAKLRREERVFEETTGRSALTGEPTSPLSVSGQVATASPNPFSLNKEFNLRKGDDFAELLPIAEQAARRGVTFRTDPGLRAPAFYADVAQRRGASVADLIMQQTQQKENERRLKRPIARSLNRIAGARD